MIDYNKAKKRFSDKKRDDIRLCEDEYVQWSVKAKFYDKIEQDYFWAIPYNVLANNGKHPNRLKKEKSVSFEQAVKRLLKNKNVELCKDGWKGWCAKSKFYDKIEQDYFYSIPKDVLKNNSGHPNRSNKKRTEKNRLTFKEAQERFSQQRPGDIELCEKGWKGWTKKSKFYDFVAKDYWEAIPAHVYGQKSSHPKRHGKEMITVEMAIKKFLAQRTDVVLCKEGYEGWSKKGKFFDKNIDEFFYAQPKSVYKQKSNHPKLKYEKAKKTSVKKYGKFHLLNHNTIKKRNKQLIKKHGSITPFADENIQKKRKKTCLEKYGTDSPLKLKFVQEKRKKTCLEKYGTKYPFIGSATKYFVKETDESISDWLKKQSEPKPAYTSLIQQLQKIDKFQYDKIKICVLKKIIEDFGAHKTTLEVLGEQLFFAVHYNKKPKQISKTYKPDFKLSETVFVNVDGLYWHSEQQKDKHYHFEMHKHFEENNLRIMHFREDEIINKPYICKSIVNNAIGKTPNKIYARKCTVKKVPNKEAKIFLEQNHLMGSITAKHIGLYFNNTLVFLFSYKEKKYICKIERFCSIIHYNIVGGFSKLLNYLENNCLKSTTTEIHNWIDLRYGTGTHLLSKDFIQTKETLSWKWTDCTNTFNRLKYKANTNGKKLTQQQYAAELGWFKIYDAGQRLYVKLKTL